MANHLSAKTRIRRNQRRNAINGNRVSRIRSYVKAVEMAVAAGDRDAARAAFKTVQPELHRGVRAGVMHANTASRKISRLNARVKAMQ